MSEAGRPLILPNPVTTPSAGVSFPFMAGEILAWLARSPISWKEPGSKSRATRSRTVSFPSACCLAMASAPPMASAFSRRTPRSSARSFMPIGYPFTTVVRYVAMPVSGGRAAGHGEHGRDPAPMMGGVIHHVLEEGAEGDGRRHALVVDVGHEAHEVALGEAVHEGPLLHLQEIPPRAQPAHRGEIGVALHTRGRRALPAGKPDAVGPVEMGEHALEGGQAPVLAHVMPHHGLAHGGRDAEEPSVPPPVIAPDLLDQLDAHVTS